MVREGRGTRLGVSSLLLMAHQVCEALVPVLIGVAVDRAIRPSDPVALLWTLLALAALFTALTASWRMGFRLTTTVFTHGQHALRQRILGRVLHARKDGHRQGSGTVLSIATSDTAMTSALSWTVAEQLAALAALVTAAVSLLLISWPLGLGVLVATAVFLVVMHLVTKPLEERTSRQQAAAAEATHVATDLVTGLRVLQGIGAVGPAAERYRAVSRRSLDAALSRARSHAVFNAVTVLLSGLFLAGIAWAAASQAVAGTITVGQLVAVVGLAQVIRDPMSMLSFFAAELAGKRAAAVRVADVLTGPGGSAATTGHTGAGSGPGPAGVVLQAGTGDSAWTVELAEDRIVGVATDGAAAQRIADALSGRATPGPGMPRVLTADPAAGTVDPDAEGLRRRVFVAGHDAAVFTGTARHNLFTARIRPELLSAAAADEVLEHLPRGLDSQVGEQGRFLSGGQRQRLLLARALHQPQPFLALVDPTSAVDSVTEARIAEGLRRVCSGGLLLVTTSPLLLGICDVVVHTTQEADRVQH